MSKGNSKSSSKVTTTTTTEQKDERVAATDAAIAVGAGNTGTISIDQLPDGLGDYAQGFLNLFQQQQAATFQAGQAAIDAASKNNDDKKTYLIIGLAGLAIIALITKF